MKLNVPDPHRLVIDSDEWKTVNKIKWKKIDLQLFISLTIFGLFIGCHQSTADPDELNWAITTIK